MPRFNQQITGPEVRVIGADGEMLGVLAMHDALRLAGERNLDLVEVNPDAEPPVCKIMRHYADRPTEPIIGARGARRVHDEVYGKARPTEDRIVDTILLEMTDRRGFRHEWQRFDSDVKDEIRATWVQIVRDALGVCPGCGRDRLGPPSCDLCDNDE